MLKLSERIRGVLGPILCGSLILSFDVWASGVVFVPKSLSLETACTMGLCHVCEGLDYCCGVAKAWLPAFFFCICFCFYFSIFNFYIFIF